MDAQSFNMRKTEIGVVLDKLGTKGELCSKVDKVQNRSCCYCTKGRTI